MKCQVFCRNFLFILGFLYGLNAYANVRDNFFLGAKTGGVFNHYTVKAQNTLNGFLVKRSSNTTDVIGNVFIGYGKTFKSCFYLGVELGTNFPNRDESITRDGVFLTSLKFTDCITIKDYILGDFLPGYRICKSFLAYLRIGASFGRIKMKQLAVETAPEFKNKKNIFGGRFGFGISHEITKHFDIGIDYYYAFYQDLKVKFQGYNTKVKTSLGSHFVEALVAYSF